MVDLVKEQLGLPVNIDGEVVATIGTGSRTIAGALPANSVPVNASGQMVFNLETADGGSVVTAQTNPVTGGIIKTLWTGTQAQYDAIATKDANTMYVIVG